MNKKILIVNDSDDNLFLLSIYFKDHAEIEVVTANSGEKAITLFEKESFDLVLLDINMPGMDGFETLEKIRTIKREVKIFALTGSTLDEEIEKIMEAGFDKHLAKPIRKQALLDLVNEELG